MIKYWQEDDYTGESMSMVEQEKLFFERHHVYLENIYYDMFQDLDRNMRILEIGCNVGHKLRRLQMMGFKNLYGIDINQKAIRIARAHHPGINFIHGEFLKWDTQETFDLVMTNFVAQHIEPDSQVDFREKVKQITKKYIFMLEFHDDSNEPIPVTWKGRDDLTWKRNWKNFYYDEQTLPFRYNKINRPDGFVDSAILFRKFNTIDPTRVRIE